MTRVSVLIPAMVVAGALSAFAQEAPPLEPTHEKFTVATEPKSVTFVADFVGRYLGDGSGEEKPGLPRGFLPEEMVAATLEEADDEAPLPVVNGRFPWRRGAAMWPCVIEALPQLPQLPHELQYRLVGRDLVLVDTHAELIVDILRHVVR